MSEHRDLLPLTRAQRGVVVAMAVWSDSAAYLLAETIDLRGDVDADAWVAAIRAMIAVTPAQRIVLVRSESQTWQRVVAPSQVPVRMVDVSGTECPERAAERAIDDDRRSWQCAPTDAVTTAHLVIVLGPGHVRWYHRAHHVALDGYGFALCATRVADCYRQGGHGDVDGAGGLDEYHAVIENDLVYPASPQHDSDRRWWHTQLSGRLPRTLADPGTTAATVIREGRSVGEWADLQVADYSLSEIVIAAVALHTARRTRGGQTTLGVPMMNRLGSIVARVPAMLLNVVALQVDIDESESVVELLERVRRGLAQAARRGQYRHEDLRRELGRLGPDRPLTGPMVNIMPFDYGLDVPRVHAEATNVSAGPVEDISFQVYLRSGKAAVFVDANGGRYTRKDVVAHAEAVIATVVELATELARPRATRKVATVMRSDHVVSLPSSAPVATVDDRIRQWAVQDSDAVAIRCGQRVWSRGYLQRQVQRRADELRAQGIGRGDVVRVVRDDRCTAVVDMLAAGRVGAAYCAAAVKLSEPLQSSPSAGGYLVLTSGTSGARKAIRVPGSALDCFIDDAIARYGWTADDVIATVAPLHTDTSVEEIFGALCAGATLVVPLERGPHDPGGLLDLARAERISVFDLPTSVWHELVPLVEGAVVPSSLRQIVVGGEELSSPMMRRWEAACDVAVVNSYGPSETTVVNVAGPARGRRGCDLGTALPHSGLLVRVDRGDVGQSVDSGAGTSAEVVGELVIFGPVVANGYVGHPSSAFGEVVVGGRRFRSYCTGDVVSVDVDGQIQFRERVDDLVKIGGERVRLRTIEDVLMAVPGVSAAMVARSGRYSLTAYVVGSADMSGMSARLVAELPPSWVPRRIERVSQLPRTANAKIDRGWSTPDRANRVARQQDSCGRARVRGVLTDVLGYCPSDDENLFASGVTSMQAVAIAGRLQQQWGRPVRVDLVLSAASIAGLAAELASDAGDEQVGFDLPGELAALGVPDMCREGSNSSGQSERSTAVLLTGATGFVGRVVLGRLLASGGEVVATVRAADDAAAVDRLRRIAPVEAAVRSGQLRVTALPLPEVMADVAFTFGSVLHCAARISAVAAYRELRSDNVELAATVTREAARRGTPLVFVSTATASNPDGSLADPSHMPTGYARSKCVVERMLAEVAASCGLPVRVVRLPRVLPDATTGPNDDDFLLLLGRVSVAAGVVPRTSAREPVVTVGAAADAMVRLVSGRVGGGFGIVDLWSADVAVTDVLAADSAVSSVSVERWREVVAGLPELPDSDRAGALLWADLLLGGYDRQWDSNYRASVAAPSAADAARALGVCRLWSRTRA